MKTCPRIIEWISLLFLVTSSFHLENASGQRKLFEDDEPAVEGGAEAFTASSALKRSTDVEVRLDETKLGELPDGDKFYASRYSRDGCHIACLIKKGSKQLVGLDGKLGPEFDEVQNVSISADGSRVGYWGKKDGKGYVVVDHRIGQECDEASVVFSNDGKRVACLITKGGKAFAVIDGEAGPQFDQVSSFAFSPNGKRFGYKAATGDGYFFFVDGKLGPKAAMYGVLTFSLDGSRLACGIAYWHGAHYYIVDGVKEEEYDRTEDFVFSPDGKHYAYVAERRRPSEGWRQAPPDRVVVVDGKPKWPGYDSVDKLTFSPDGRRLAYVASRGRDEQFMVVNGEVGPSFDEVCKYTGQLAFSPDSKHLAYVASRFPSILVCDGKQQEPKYQMIWGLAFSPDSAHLAYKAADGDKEFVVVDGKPGPKYEKLSFTPLSFRADGTVEYLGYKEGWYYRVKQSSPAWVSSAVPRKTVATETTPVATPERTKRSSLFEDDEPVPGRQTPPARTVPSTRRSSLFEDEEPAPKEKTPAARSVTPISRSGLFEDDEARPATRPERPSLFEDDDDVSKGPSGQEQTSPSSARVVTTPSLKERRYTRTHKWVSLRGAIAVVGITDFAPSKIGDVVSVELPRVGEKTVEGGECAKVKFVIATIGIDCPLSGEIVRVNEKLKHKPELLNSDPYGEGWILEVRPSDLSELWLLMDAAQYQKMTEEQ